MVNYAVKVKECRLKMILTQEEFAKKLGVSVNSVIRWEKGQFEPTMKVKKRLQQFFIDAGISVE